MRHGPDRNLRLTQPRELRIHLTEVYLHDNVTEGLGHLLSALSAMEDRLRLIDASRDWRCGKGICFTIE